MPKSSHRDPHDDPHDDSNASSDGVADGVGVDDDLIKGGSVQHLHESRWLMTLVSFSSWDSPDQIITDPDPLPLS